jgi:hypothetical protein
MSLAGRSLEPLLEDLVSEDGLKEGVHHLSYQPHPRDFFERPHAGSYAVLRNLLDGRDRGSHLIDVHDESGEKRIHHEGRAVS